MQTHTQKGFTLIELLVVIAIVAVLSVVVILTLNPAELLRQARDSSRVSDMSTLKSAVSLYLADVSTPSIATGTVNCYTSNNNSTSSACGGRFTIALTNAGNPSVSRTVDGNGWLPINLASISSGSPVGNLPVDPVNNLTYYYAYAASTTSLTFEINANMESSRYAQSGSGDVESTDGGNQVTLYEVGTYPALSM